MLKRRAFLTFSPIRPAPPPGYWQHVSRPAMACRFEVTLPLEDQAGVSAARPMVPDITFTTGNIVALGTCVFFLALTGMMMFDLIKNLGSWEGPYGLNSAMMDFVLGFF